MTTGRKPAKPAATRIKTATAPKVKAVSEAAPAAPATQQQEIRTVATKKLNETVAEQMTEQATKAAETGKAMFAKASEQATAAVEKQMKTAEEMNVMARDNLEAVTASGRAAAQGIESLTQHWMDVSKKAVEASTVAFRNMAAAKTPNEFFQMHNEFTKAQFDALVQESSKMTEAMLKIAGDVFEPLSQRFAATADKFKAQPLR